MDEPTFAQRVLRDNWYLVVLLVAVAGFVAYKIIAPASVDDGLAVPVTPVATFTEIDTARPDRQSERLARREKTLKTIEEHKAVIEADPEAEEAPARLNAMASLYSRELGDYKEAARCYEFLLLDYPEWEGLRRVYVHLGLCYERLGDTQSAKQAYRRMMDAFPEESQEYQYAMSKLYEPAPSRQ
ncbi:MAG: tetratricopeptide repeat protein [Candidatus Hydrogenedentes bacterium]|nr:tetratricopeptide repeat protein [Candidatus Hydrogenedentota bacterium]